MPSGNYEGNSRYDKFYGRFVSGHGARGSEHFDNLIADPSKGIQDLIVGPWYLRRVGKTPVIETLPLTSPDSDLPTLFT